MNNFKFIAFFYYPKIYQQKYNTARIKCHEIYVQLLNKTRLKMQIWKWSNEETKSHWIKKIIIRRLFICIISQQLLHIHKTAMQNLYTYIFIYIYKKKG